MYRSFVEFSTFEIDYYEVLKTKYVQRFVLFKINQRKPISDKKLKTKYGFERERVMRYPTQNLMTKTLTWDKLLVGV